MNTNFDLFFLNQLLLSKSYIVYEFTNFLVAVRLSTVHIYVVKKKILLIRKPKSISAIITEFQRDIGLRNDSICIHTQAQDFPLQNIPTFYIKKAVKKKKEIFI